MADSTHGALFSTSRSKAPRLTIRPLGRAARAASRLSLLVVSWSVVGLMTAVPAQSAEPLEVPPGGLARWDAGGGDRCAMDGKEWTPIAGSCWYPVDLLRKAGKTTVRRRVDGSWQSRALKVAAYPYDVQHITLKDESRVNVAPVDMDRVRREQRAVGSLWSLRSERRFELPLGPPLRNLPDGGRFGSRRFFNGQPRSPHSGADYAATEGTPVLSTEAGVVALAEEHFFAGKSVFVDHGDGLISMYFHLSAIDVEKGQVVARGERIGAVGATGRATGPHLHFGLRWRGARVDPGFLLGDPRAVPTVPSSP